MKFVERNIASLDHRDTAVLERLLGQRLRAHHQLQIIVTGEEKPLDLPTDIELDTITKFALYSPCFDDEDPCIEDSMLLLWDNERDEWLTYLKGEFSGFPPPRIGLDSRGIELVIDAFGTDPNRFKGQDPSKVHPSYLLRGKSWTDVAEGFKAEGKRWGHNVTKLPPPR